MGVFATLHEPSQSMSPIQSDASHDFLFKVGRLFVLFVCVWEPRTSFLQRNEGILIVQCLRGLTGGARGWLGQRKPVCFPVISTWDAKSTCLDCAVGSFQVQYLDWRSAQVCSRQLSFIALSAPGLPGCSMVMAHSNDRLCSLIPTN